MYLLAMIVGLRAPAWLPLHYVRREGRSSTVAPECVERWERVVRCDNFGCTSTLTATKLPACISWRCSLLCTLPHARSLPLLLTDLGCRRPRPSLPHHTHTTRHNFALTNTHTARPPNYLDVAPGDTGRYAHTRVPADPFRSAQMALQR